MDFKVKSSIAVDVANHVFNFYLLLIHDYQHYWKIKKSRYCWGIGVYRVFHWACNPGELRVPTRLPASYDDFTNIGGLGSVENACSSWLHRQWNRSQFSEFIVYHGRGSAVCKTTRVRDRTLFSHVVISNCSRSLCECVWGWSSAE